MIVSFEILAVKTALEPTQFLQLVLSRTRDEWIVAGLALEELKPYLNVSPPV